MANKPVGVGKGKGVRWTWWDQRPKPPPEIPREIRDLIAAIDVLYQDWTKKFKP